MVSGEFPFYDTSIQNIIQKILKSSPMYPEYFSDDVKYLLNQVFKRDPKKEFLFH
jgi:hypothetical protein